MSPLLLALAAAVASSSPADTVLALDGADRVVLETFEGVLVVRGTEDEVVRVQDREGGAFRVRSSRGTLTVEPREKGVRDVVVELPRGVGLRVRSRNRVELEVTGMTGGVSARLTSGDLQLSDLSGTVEVTAVGADVRIRGVEGELDVETIEGEVMLREVTGASVRVETVSGEIVLEGVRAPEVAVASVEGAVRWEGEIARGSRVSVTNHDGDVTIGLPEPGDVETAVSTFDGTFTSDYPVIVSRVGAGRPIEFTIGAPHARLVIEVFDSDVRILRR